MRGWIEASRIYFDRRILAILFLGFSSGLPLLLVYGTLSYWLGVEGVSLATIGFFSLARLPYTFKFLWAPLIDQVRLPIVHRLIGHRRSWALLSQACLIASIIGLGYSNPSETPELTALFAVLVAFFSATQDILIDAYRIELLKDDEQGAGAAMYVNGYRLGMLIAGAVAIGLSDWVSWPVVYTIMGGLIGVGMITILLNREPENLAARAQLVERDGQYDELVAQGKAPWLAALIANFNIAVIQPFKDFMTRAGWIWVLVFIILYKMGEAMLGAMANPFYHQIGFSGAEIASVTKVFGLAATIIGGMIGGIVVYRYGVMRALLYCGIVQMLSTLLFAIQAEVGHHIPMLMVAISGENVTAGMATTAFVAYLSSQCNTAYTATQYALLSSFMAIPRDMFAAFSGVLAEQVGWVGFFVACSAIAAPALVLLMWMMKRFDHQAKNPA
ncbi:Permease of the major facilitator superfamily,AmpG-like [Candidatus Terasakiella magnetica]|uniref:Permease of the major facilitator superfamily,AmpG-like n=1 Tax=Candidatus Terasakiella magnetica TaxID=1867952 RepID=A0A1C3RGJ9_9PROT|nr:AmpG family muropeptide MFS transporter [Candidatus Terasakiella magnetica]SCA56420.1 Permease of the major facilitator superfamily,AmpG-like [Candidatus Terasakiella magnetica]